jgi:hypothetical protein
MAWEWAPPLATAVVAVIGVAGTWLAGRTQARITLESVRINAIGSQQLAREERNQKRIETVYRDLDRNLSIVESQLRRLTSSVTSGPEQTLDDLPSDYLSPSVLEALNQDRLYRSSRVQLVMSRFEDQVAFLKGNFTTVYMLGPHLRDDSKLVGALESNVMMYAERALEAVNQVRNQMSAELRGDVDSDSASHPVV